MRRRIFTFAIFAALIVAIYGLYQLATQPVSPLHVAFVVEMETAIGSQMFDAAQLALAAYDGSLNVELLPYDVSSGSDDEAQANMTNAARTLGANEMVVAVIDATRSAYLAHALREYNEANLPVITPGATWPGFTKPGFEAGEPGIYYPSGTRNLFRTIPNDEAQGVFAARWLAQQDVETVHLLVQKDDVYSRGLAGILEANAGDYNMQVVGRSVYDPQAELATQTEPILDDIAASGADALFSPMTASIRAHRVLEPIRAAYPDLLILGTDGLVNENLAADGTQFERVYATTLAANPPQAFMERYEAALGVEPPLFAVTSYDAMVAILAALEQARYPASRLNVLQSLNSLTAIEGVTGTWSFDEDGDITLISVRILRYDDGEWHPDD